MEYIKMKLHLRSSIHRKMACDRCQMGVMVLHDHYYWNGREGLSSEQICECCLHASEVPKKPVSVVSSLAAYRREKNVNMDINRLWTFSVGYPLFMDTASQSHVSEYQLPLTETINPVNVVESMKGVPWTELRPQ